ncbi:redoxin domain-containing protein, partial [Bacillus thuringiensis]|uniref:redoxin domain-containing protein n=1 Tax=Bacillus thuringiensis TaxID=1428 RepID=UPI003BFA6E57
MPPQFTLHPTNPQELTLPHFPPKNLLLYFYPKHITPPSTTQPSHFPDPYPLFQHNHTLILPLTPQSANTHLKFIQKHQLPFTLLLH